MGKERPPEAPFGRPIELPGALGVFARAVGGTAKLSALVGVTPRTLQRWGKTAPPQYARMLLARLARARRLPEPILRELEHFNRDCGAC